MNNKKSVAETNGRHSFEVYFVLSYKGKDLKDDKGELIEIYISTLDLEGVLNNTLEDMLEIVYFSSDDEIIFDAWRPYRILEYTLKDKEEHEPYVEEEPFLVWSEEDNGTFH